METQLSHSPVASDRCDGEALPVISPTTPIHVELSRVNRHPVLFSIFLEDRANLFDPNFIKFPSPGLTKRLLVLV